MRFKLTIVAALLLALFATFAPNANAQDTRGTIVGTVTDPNGGVVANATVQVKDPSRGTNKTFTTNGEGMYRATFLTSGIYQVMVEAQGFKRAVRDNVLVEIAATVTVNIPLEVGGTEETVNVTADVPAINTENASLGLVVDGRRLEDLPLVHGDPYKLIGLAPGVTHTGSQRLDRPFEPTHIVGYAMDGTRGNRSDLTIDGAPSTATANANEVIASYVPPSDIVQEFKVQTATFDAQFGNTEGGVTSISIKSGANALHGSAYYFGQPGNWAANDAFGKARGNARPETKADRFGGYISGPVVLPWLYNGKDKTFFLFGYEGIRDARPRFDAGEGPWVPTAALAAGDFSQFACAPGQTTGCVTVYDPMSRVACGSGQFCGTAFANNRIPDARISPVAKAVLEYWAKPKNPGLTGNIFDSGLTEVTEPYDNYTFRIDQNITNNNHLFVRGSYYDRVSFYNDYTANEYTGVSFAFKARQGVIDDVHTFNSTTFLNVRYAYNRFIRAQDQEPDAQGFDLTNLWGPTAGATYNNLIPESIRRFPRFDFSNGPLGNGMSNEFRPVGSHSFAATLNKIIESHAIKFGGELRVYREDDSFASNDQTGQFVFNNTYTRAASNTANNATIDYLGLQSYAAFLLGLPTTQTVVRRADYSEYSKTWGFFVQDDWKVTRKLTLNLGLRYEVEQALVERQNKSISGFDTSYTQPFDATVRARLAATPVTDLSGNPIPASSFSFNGGLQFAGVDTGSGLYATPKNILLPRFGVAYQLNSKTVLRGGFGLFAGFLGERRGDVIQPGYTRTSELPTTRVNGNPLDTTSAPIPQSISLFPTVSILEPVGNSLGKQTGLGGAITYFNQDPRVSKQARWQVGFQRDLGLGFVAEVTYVGNFGYDIEINRNINAVPNSYFLTGMPTSAEMTARNNILTANVNNPFRNVAGFEGTGHFTGATLVRQTFYRPLPMFGDITSTNNDGKSWYHAAQLSLQRRFANGWTLGSSYTWSKWLQATEYLNAGDESPTKMISDQDTPHRLSVSGIYELPFGKGKALLSDGAILDRFVGGWQIQGVYQFQVGFPIRFTNSLFYLGGDVSLEGSERTTQRWFNTAAFSTVNPVATLRTLPFFFSDVRRDNINNVDLSILKNTRINERMRIQFKMDFINAFNEPYIAAPVTALGGTFGAITASNQDNYARRIQYGIKFLF
ncbi:MAG: TonB-dependent receptor [Pyrinomonadaceae bacterium]